ncbi:MAG: hypothetical protein LBG22_11570 [Treponema sp.]|jgi:hypothetical protein|nr:hypothetical protein [Treponema sp.]
MKNPATVFFLGLCLLFVSPLPAQEPGIPKGTDPERLLNRPEPVSSSIVLINDPPYAVWIRMKADVHTVIPEKLETMRSLVFAWEDYPKHFKRLKENWIERRQDGTVFKMHLSVGLMGIYYDSVYTLFARAQIDTPKKLLIEFAPLNRTEAYISEDGTVRRPLGLWYLEEIEVRGEPCTYVRYIADGEVLKKYPLQDTVMALFVDREHQELLKQLSRAVKKSKLNPKVK